MTTFTDIFCEACGEPGRIVSADGWNLCMEHFMLPKPSRKRFDRRTGEAIPLPQGESPDEPLLVLAEEVRPSCYLTSADVSAVARQGHWGLAASGDSRRWMEEFFPGWGWKEITDAIRRVGAFHKPKMHGGYLDRSYVGCLLSSAREVTLDDGSLDHPLKAARLAAGEERPPAPPRRIFSNRYHYGRPFCELCGSDGGCVTPDGWSTCIDHFDVEKPTHPLFERRTGEPIDPEQAPG
jgi:hypothetical protein